VEAIFGERLPFEEMMARAQRLEGEINAL